MKNRAWSDGVSASCWSQVRTLRESHCSTEWTTSDSALALCLAGERVIHFPRLRTKCVVEFADNFFHSSFFWGGGALGAATFIRKFNEGTFVLSRI
jgi:hypothetical protein